MSKEFTVTLDIKDAFFDRARVVKWLEEKDRRALSRIGAFIRKRAITDVLRRQAPSGLKRGQIRDRRGRFAKQRKFRPHAAPGKPPLVHSRDKFANLRNILFGLDMTAQSVRIGPVKVNGRKSLRGSNAITVPELMEFGGHAKVLEWQFVGAETWLPGSPPRESAGTPTVMRLRTVNYAPHPFMAVALAKEVAAGTCLDSFASVHR